MPESPTSRVDATLVAVGAVGIAAFAVLLAASASVYDAVVDADGVAGLDRPVLDAMVAARTPALEAVATAFTNLGRTLPMVLVGLTLTTLLWWRWRRRTTWVLMLLASAGSVTFTLLGKAAVGRTRPPLSAAVPPYEASPSFPSGHTLNSTVVAGMLAYLFCWLAQGLWTRLLVVLAAVFWAGAMGFSRVFLGHHWLTDVVFAWLFGLAWLALLATAHQLVWRFNGRSPGRFGQSRTGKLG